MRSRTAAIATCVIAAASFATLAGLLVQGRIQAFDQYLLGLFYPVSELDRWDKSNLVVCRPSRPSSLTE